MKPTEQEIELARDAAYNDAKLLGLIENIGESAAFKVAWDVCTQWAISQMQPEWVPVTERLPQGPDIVYLVCVKNKNKENGIPLIDIAVFDSDGIWQKSTVWEDVTHWMPLPNPPKSL